MRLNASQRLGPVVITTLLVGITAGAALAQLSISRFTIDGGGGTRSTGGTFGLGGTIGQPDAGRLSGSSFTLNGGFWPGGGAVSAVENATPGGGSDPSKAPPAFRLYPARPNPVAERTVIAFDLPRRSLVQVALFDVAGRLVYILADESLPAGRHLRAWDRRNQMGQAVPSGIYFLRLKAGAHQSRQQIVVIH